MGALLTGFFLGFIAFTETGRSMGNAMASRIGEEVKNAIRAKEDSNGGEKDAHD